MVVMVIINRTWLYKHIEQGREISFSFVPIVSSIGPGTN